jgi:hypothetical protein
VLEELAPARWRASFSLRPLALLENAEPPESAKISRPFARTDDTPGSGLRAGSPSGPTAPDTGTAPWGLLRSCWAQMELSSLDPNLIVELFGSQTLSGATGARHDKGLFISGQAVDETTGAPVTLLGFSETTEGPIAGPPNGTTSYTVRPGNNAMPILVPAPIFFPASCQRLD